MRRKLGLFAAALALVAALLGVSASPAAAHRNACVGNASMFSTGPMYYVGFGPAAANHGFTMQHAVPGFCIAFPSPETLTGSWSGHCGLSSGTGVTGMGHAFTFIIVGTEMTFSGQVQGELDVHPDVVNGESCISGADRFFANGTLYHDHL